jgi:hypothetical protein
MDVLDNISLNYYWNKKNYITYVEKIKPFYAEIFPEIVKFMKKCRKM